MLLSFLLRYYANNRSNSFVDKDGHLNLKP